MSAQPYFAQLDEYESSTLPSSNCVNGFCSISPSLISDADEVVTNELGGKQSAIKGRYDLLPYLALEEAAIVLGEGAIKYGINNWKQIEYADHLNHAYRHIARAAELSHVDKQSPEIVSALLTELSHSLVRTMFTIDRLKSSQLTPTPIQSNGNNQDKQ